MKPTPQYQVNFRRDGLTSRPTSLSASAPKTDRSFHANSIDQLKGHCSPPSLGSFRDISSDYFETEEPRAMLRETAVFAVIVMTVAMPLIHSATAVFHLIKSVGTL